MQYEDTSRIPLVTHDGSINGYALVDASDAEWLSQWTWRMFREAPPSDYYVSALRYEHRGGRRVRIRMHRQIMGLGPGRAGGEVDHRNHNPLDNRRSNLRVGTHAQNMQNREHGYSTTSSERGVRRRHDSWVASAKLNGKMHHIGAFTTESAAVLAVRSWRASNMPFSREAADAARGDGPEQPPELERSRRGATSQHRGVYWNQSKKRWVAQSRSKGRRVDIGQFRTEAEAIMAMDNWLAEQ